MAVPRKLRSLGLLTEGLPHCQTEKPDGALCVQFATDCAIAKVLEKMVTVLPSVVSLVLPVVVAALIGGVVVVGGRVVVLGMRLMVVVSAFVVVRVVDVGGRVVVDGTRIAVVTLTRYWPRLAYFGKASPALPVPLTQM
jgi:hypothetical protein